MLDADGLPIIIAINTAGDGFYQLERERVSANFISSVHGKDGFSGGIENDFISNNANNNTFLFIDKEKSQNLFRVLGVQFPVRLNDFGFDNIIRQSRNVVNSKYTQNSKKDADIDGFSVGGVETDSEGNALSEAQQEFFSGSLVTDEDGALLPVYHATDSAEFTVFDKSKLGYNTDGNTSDEGMAATAHVGFWFNTKNLTGEAGSRAEKVYLNLTNPYELTSLDVLAEEIKALGEGETPAEMGEAYATDLWLRGYDGIEIRHDEEFGGTSYVAFDENQIKRTTNKNPTKDADIRFSVGGVNAKTAEVGRLADAERMEKAGTDSETVRRETGWYRGYDGKWRFEIDDSKMRFINHREESRRTWKLDELIRHDALFAAYPELRDYTVLNFGISDDVEAAFYPGLNRITLDPRLSRAEKRTALIHEIQHAIQVIEGFAAGSSTDYWRGILKTDEERRLEMRLRDFYIPDNRFWGDMRKLLEETPAAEQDAARAALAKRYGEAPVREYADLYNRLRDMRAKREQNAERAYRDTAGEIEAADVASRLGLSAKQRAETRPDIDRTNVRFSNEHPMFTMEARQTDTDKRYEGKTLYADSEVYSYDFLTALPDISVVRAANLSELEEDGKVSRVKVTSRGKANAGAQSEQDAYIKNRYTGRMLTITNSSIRHGLHGNENSLKTNSRLSAVIGDIVKNAVPINGLVNKDANAIGTYAMAAPARGDDGRLFVAIVTIEVSSGKVTNVELKDLVHAISGRVMSNKENDPSDTKSQAWQEILRTLTNRSEISISDFLQIVNRTHQSILSADVLQHLGEARNLNGHFASEVLFSVGGEQTDADAEVSDADKRFAPVESAIRMLKGGADLWRTLRETGTQPNQIALRMATSGESDTAIRELTGLYRDALGVWTYDKAWFDAHVPDIADNRELRAGYRLGAVDEQKF